MFKNDILEDNGKWLVIDISTIKNPNVYMKIDKISFKMLNKIGCGRIYANKKSIRDKAYAMCRYKSKNTTVQRILIRGFQYIDHINHDTLDNRKTNLRGCTSSQNSMNRTPSDRDLPTGVTLNNNKKRYRAGITINGKCIHLGIFDSIIDATKSRKAAEIKYFMEFAHGNCEVANACN